MTSTEINLPASSGRARTPERVGQATAVEQARAVAEVQAAIIVAQQCPRSITEAVAQMRESCQQSALAERAFFRYNRAGSQITGESIHLARELARCWGNIQYGLVELSRDDDRGESEMLAFAWDVQTNTRPTTTFIVKHGRDTRDGRKALTELRDIYENNANMGARRVREQIFAILPKWFTEEAKEVCRRTIENGGDVPLSQRVASIIRSFGDLGVSVAQLEVHLGRQPDAWTAHDVAALTIIGRSIKNGETTVEDEFPQQRVTAAEITGKPAARAKKEKAERDLQPPPAVEPAPEPESSGLDEFHPDTTRNPATDDGALPLGEPPADPPITGAQSRIMHALLNENGLGGREDGLAWIGAKIGREIDTSKDLTKQEASQVIDALQNLGKPGDD